MGADELVDEGVRRREEEGSKEEGREEEEERETQAGRLCHEEEEGCLSYTKRFTQIVSFWPPKPKELERHVCTPPEGLRSRAALGT